jgi:hypothetical protein
MGVYKWKESTRFSADAQAIGEELESIGTLKPGDIVEFAEDEKTELHKCFTWDDSKAAHLYRVEEARGVVQAVITVDESPDREPVEYRAFESVIVDGERRYMPTRTILNDEDMRAQVLGEIGSAIGELSSKAKTYRYLAQRELDTAQRHLELAREAVTA